MDEVHERLHERLEALVKQATDMGGKDVRASVLMGGENPAPWYCVSALVDVGFVSGGGLSPEDAWQSFRDNYKCQRSVDDSDSVARLRERAKTDPLAAKVLQVLRDLAGNGDPGEQASPERHDGGMI